MALHDTVNYNTILGNLSREINRLDVDTQAVAESYGVLYNTPDDSDKIRRYEVIIAGLISSYSNFSKYWSKYCSLFNEAREDEDKFLTELRIKSSLLVDNYNKLFDKLGLVVESLNTSSNNLNYLYEAITNLDTSNNKVIAELDEAASSIVYKRATKAKGEANPNTKRGIKTEDLIHDYIEAGYVLSNEVVSKYNQIEPVTYHGLRRRLVEAGVWVSKRNGGK